MDLKTSGIYSFEVYPVAQFGTKYKNVKVLSILDPDDVVGMDIRAMHAMVYNTLPPSTPNDPKGYNYIKIRLPSGETEILGSAWIIADTVQVISLGDFTVTIKNRSSGDQQAIVNALSANGITIDSIVFKSGGT